MVELTYGKRRSPNREIKLPKYLSLDKKVLCFSGYFREDVVDWSNESYRIRQVKVMYYLQNDTMEVIEPKVPNSGLIQGTMFKRQVLPHPKGNGRQYSWKDLNIGVDLMIYGKSIHLTDCDPWTREYLITAGIELNDPEPTPLDPYLERQLSRPLMRGLSVAVPDAKTPTCEGNVRRFYGMSKDELSEPPKVKRVQIFPPHNGIGTWDDSLQNCISLIPRRPKKNMLKEMRYDGKALRFKAELVTPVPEDKDRRFVVTFYPSDDTVAINEESIQNSGFPGGAFLKRSKLFKTDSNPSFYPSCYTSTDFGIGQEIRACGKLFKLKDADRFVFTFIEDNPDLFTEEQIQTHKKYSPEPSKSTQNIEKERSDLINEMRDEVVKSFGTSQYPLPSCLSPQCDLQYKEKTLEELCSSDMPISIDSLRKAIYQCTDHNDKTDMYELRKILLPALGHNCDNN